MDAFTSSSLEHGWSRKRRGRRRIERISKISGFRRGGIFTYVRDKGGYDQEGAEEEEKEKAKKKRAEISKKKKNSTNMKEKNKKSEEEKDK